MNNLQSFHKYIDIYYMVKCGHQNDFSRS